MNPSAFKSIAPHTTGRAIFGSSRPIKEIENHPATPALLKELAPRSVASLFERVGITDATVLMSMMPTHALLRAFDESVWKSATSGSAKTIDYHQLVAWLIAWTEIDEQFLAEKLAAMDEDYLSTVLSRIVTIESAGRYAVYWEDRESLVGLCEDDRERIGPYIVSPNNEQDREVVIGALRALWSFDTRKAASVLALLSDLRNPADSPRGSATAFHDVEFARETHGESEGFVSREGALAFLTFAEQLTVPDILALDTYDPETRRHLEALSRASAAKAPTAHPVIADDAEGEERDDDAELSESNVSMQVSDQSNPALLRAILENLELLPKQNSCALLQDLRESKDRALTIALRRLADDDPESFHARARELAYLANVLRWVPSNAHDTLSDNDARAAAFAICNLGYELASEANMRVWKNEPGLIRDFLLGLDALASIPSQVVGAFAAALSQSTLPAWLQVEATAGLTDVRRAVEHRRFEEAGEGVLFLSIVFDARLCHAVAPLLSPIPRISKLLEGGDSNDCRWIDTKSDLQLIERLLDSLRPKPRDRRAKK